MIIFASDRVASERQHPILDDVWSRQVVTGNGASKEAAAPLPRSRRSASDMRASGKAFMPLRQSH